MIVAPVLVVIERRDEGAKRIVPPSKEALRQLLSAAEALLIRDLLDHTVTQAVQMAPLLAPLGGDGAIQDGQAQARPSRFAVIRRRQRVAILHVGRDHRQRQDVPLGIDHHDTLAPDPLLGPVVAAQAARAEALDALILSLSKDACR